jgi:hypothetical protein
MLFYFGHIKEGVTKRDKRTSRGIIVKNATKPTPYISSVTSVTKRDKRDKSHLGNRRDSVTTPPVGGLSCHACPGTVQNPLKDLAVLKAEVLRYVDGYTSRGYHAEGIALARLRKAAER